MPVEAPAIPNNPFPGSAAPPLLVLSPLLGYRENLAQWPRVARLRASVGRG